jgi:hypothetical protein
LPAVNHDRYAARTVTLVTDFDVIHALQVSRAALDSAIDVFLRHALGLGFVHRQPQTWIGRDIATADTRRDRDFPDQLGEELAALLVLATLPVLNIRPFTMSGHKLPGNSCCVAQNHGV